MNEPPVGSVVRDALHRRWLHVVGPYGDSYWVSANDPINGEPESWIKVSGNYGPVVQ